MRRLVWTDSAYGGQQGRAGGLSLFTISFGMKRQDAMWSLSTYLPVRSKLLGQHYATPDEAKDAAERLLASFIRKVSGDGDGEVSA